VTFHTGRIQPADLAPLEQLKKLRALTLASSRQAEEGGQACLAGFPDTLLKLKGLTSLAISSQGKPHGREGGRAGGCWLVLCCVDRTSLASLHCTIW